MAKFYAGIGSRQTPLALEHIIKQLVIALGGQGYTLRSGGADGADSMFERHATKKEIYLPWRGFNGNSSSLYTVSSSEFALAEKYHPAWDRLSQAAKKLMARNCFKLFDLSYGEPEEVAAPFAAPLNQHFCRVCILIQPIYMTLDNYLETVVALLKNNKRRMRKLKIRH